MTFVIAGATGNSGHVAAHKLLAMGKPVRALVRDVTKASGLRAKGAEIVSVNLLDEKALTQALSGASGAYLLIPPTMGEPNFRAYQSRAATALAAAVKNSGIPEVVFLSSLGAELPSGNGPIAGLHEAEAKLWALSGTRSTFLRAAYFMENLATSFSQLEQGVLGSFLPATLALPMVATEDLGDFAAARLVEGTRATEVVQVMAATPISMNDVAAELSQILKKPITVGEAPLSALVPTLTTFGVPADLAEMYREMHAAFIAGTIAPLKSEKLITGTVPLSQVLNKLLPPRG